MAAPTPNKTFFLETPAHYLEKLRWDCDRLNKEYRSDPAFVYQFMNCAQTAWHMVDWIAATFTAPKAPDGKQISSLKKEVRDDCVALLICRELADAAKHRFLTNAPHADIACIRIGADVGSEAFQFWCIDSYSTTDVRLNGDSLGVQHPVVIINEAIEYWAAYIGSGRVPTFVTGTP